MNTTEDVTKIVKAASIVMAQDGAKILRKLASGDNEADKVYAILGVLRTHDPRLQTRILSSIAKLVFSQPDPAQPD